MKRKLTREEYYREFLEWHCDMHLSMIRDRSIIYCGLAIVALCTIATLLTIYSMFPIYTTASYISTVHDIYHNRTNIIKADAYPNDPMASMANIFAKHYIIRREEYKYDALKQQLEYIHNRSSDAVFTAYYNYISLDNKQSPVLQYKQAVERSVEIVEIDFDAVNKRFDTTFYTTATLDHKRVEKILWKCLLKYDMGNIQHIKDIHDTIEFRVIDYQLTFIKKEDIDGV